MDRLRVLNNAYVDSVVRTDALIGYKLSVITLMNWLILSRRCLTESVLSAHNLMIWPSNSARASLSYEGQTSRIMERSLTFSVVGDSEGQFVSRPDVETICLDKTQ